MAIARALHQRLEGRPKITIAIDGAADHQGKSTLGRFLAWELAVPLIETDLLIISDQEPPSYRYEDLSRLVSARHRLGRPVLIEGIFMLHTLQKIGIPADILVYVTNPNFPGSSALRDPLTKYLKEFAPMERADFRFSSEFAD